jgi:hypothetical protein
LKNQRKFLDSVAKELNIKQMSDWYEVTGKVNFLQFNNKRQDIEKFGGQALLVHKYSSSLSNLLSSVFPEYDWLPWKLDKCPNNFWSVIKNQKKFIEWVAKEKNVVEMSDWYKIKIEVVLLIY